MADAIQIRGHAADIAVRAGVSSDKILDFAKEVETFLWGGLQPVPSVGPLGDLDQIDSAVKKLAADQPAEKQPAIATALAQWERFMADMTAALS